MSSTHSFSFSYYHLPLFPIRVSPTMIRERMTSEKQQVPSAPATPTLSHTEPQEWHNDIVEVTKCIRVPCFSQEAIQLRAQLISAVKRTPYDVEKWRQLLTQINDDRLEHKDLPSADGSEHSEMHLQLVRLYETATNVLPRSSANRYSPVYLSIWLDLAKCHEEMSRGRVLCT